MVAVGGGGETNEPGILNANRKPKHGGSASRQLPHLVLRAGRLRRGSGAPRRRSPRTSLRADETTQREAKVHQRTPAFTTNFAGEEEEEEGVCGGG